MKKETFHKKWYYRLLQVVFWSSLVFFSISLILLGWFGSDVELDGFVWAGVLVIVYLFIKRVFYYAMFGDRILYWKIWK